MTESKNSHLNEPIGKNDEIWPQAVELTKTYTGPSIRIPVLQRKLCIGQIRATHLYKALVAEGYIKPTIQNSDDPWIIINDPDLPMISQPISWLIGITLAILADFLFWDEPLGWTVALYSILLAAAIAFNKPGRSKTNLRKMRYPILLLLIAAAASIYHTSPLAILLAFLSIITMVITSRMNMAASALQWLRELLLYLRRACPQAIYDMFNSLSTCKIKNAGKRFLIGSIVTIFSLVFISLFIQANPILENIYTKISDYIKNINLNLPDDAPLQLMFILFTGLFVWTLLRFRTPDKHVSPNITASLPTLPISITDACLIAFNIVFLLQTVTDMIYLFGGAKLPEGMTYAQYAHRGFYPLWTASMIAGLFMLLAWPNDPKENPPKKSTVRFAQAWLAQNVLLLFFAMFRLYLYVCAYSLSLLRFAAAVGMVLVVVGLASIIIRIQRRKHIDWIVNTNAISVTITVALLSLTNVSSIVAQFNVAHVNEPTRVEEHLDTKYLQSLGLSSIPALVNFIKENPDNPDIDKAQQALNKLTTDFKENQTNWRAWTIENHQINTALDNR